MLRVSDPGPPAIRFGLTEEPGPTPTLGPVGGGGMTGGLMGGGVVGLLDGDVGGGLVARVVGAGVPAPEVPGVPPGGCCAVVDRVAVPTAPVVATTVVE